MRGGWTRRFVVSAATALLLISSASAQGQSSPQLLTRPDADALADAFPLVALARGIGGRAVLECQVAANGVSACRAVEDTPSDMGFGQAAETIAQGWRFQPRMNDARPTLSVARVPIEFQNPISQPAIIEGLIVDGVRGETPPAESEYPHDIAAMVCRWGAHQSCLRLQTAARRNNRDYNAAYYPARALAEGVNGRALIACAVRSERRLDCAVESEAPESWEFGSHAISLVRAIARQGGDHLQSDAVFRVAVDFAVHERGRPPADRASTQFSQSPTGQNFARLYPRAALERDISGAADLACEIKPDRRFNCMVVEEYPGGAGFGVAALQASVAFQVSESAIGQPGLAVGDRVRRVIRFQLR
jgi:TonB family protein